jgi:hypothetical protein
MKHSRLFWVIALFFLCTLPRLAFTDDILFGAEYELTNKEMLEHGTVSGFGMTAPTSPERKAADALFAAIMARCPDCDVQTVRGKNGDEKRIGFDGWWFQISYDPSCVEILDLKSSLKVRRELATKINRVLFGAAFEDCKLFTDYETGAGHVNFSANTAFGTNVDLFLEYFADFSNHPQLSMGGLGEDYSNAPALAFLQDKKKQALVKILADARENKVRSVAEAAKRIQNEVYTWTTDNPPAAAYHYQAIGLKKLNDPSFPEVDAPVELRAMYPQDSEDAFIRVGEIIERRIQFLKSQPRRLTYLDVSVPAEGFTYQDIVDNYYKYLTEMGLDWETYRTTMHPEFKDFEPGDFVTGNIHWTASYAKSLLRFTPYLQTSKWVRDRVYHAFTDPRGSKTITARKTLSKLIDSIDPKGVYANTSYNLVRGILKDPSWINNPDRAVLLEQINTRANQKSERLCDQELLP